MLITIKNMKLNNEIHDIILEGMELAQHENWSAADRYIRGVYDTFRIQNIVGKLTETNSSTMLQEKKCNYVKYDGIVKNNNSKKMIIELPHNGIAYSELNKKLKVLEKTKNKKFIDGYKTGFFDCYNFIKNR